MEPTRKQDRASRRSAIVIGLGVGVLLLIVAVAGPPYASNFFKQDPHGSPGNPTRTEAVPSKQQ
jgi:hypothetical protein